MTHHLSVGSNDISRAESFYTPLFAVIGWRLISGNDESLDYGTSTVQFSVETPSDGEAAAPGNGVHIAFAAVSRAEVDRFYETALANGGTDAGPPGIRAEYDRHYYGAFVRDPDGNKIEAVTHSARHEEAS